jgi:hypothetical protein
MGRFARDFVACADIVDHGDEVVHSDQHSETLAAVQHPLVRNRSMNEWYCTDRAA